MHLSPVIGHPTCDLERQRRVLEARRDAAALAMRAEDVWHSLRI